MNWLIWLILLLINPLIDTILAWLARVHESYKFQLAQKIFSTLATHPQFKTLKSTRNPEKTLPTKAKKAAATKKARRQEAPEKDLHQSLPKVHLITQYHN